MDSIIVHIIVAAGAFWLGWHIRATVILSKLASQPEKMIKILEQIKGINEKEAQGEFGPERIDSDELRIERVGDQLYAYHNDSGEFVSQGSDLVTVLELAHARFPDRVFFGTIESDDPAKELAVKS
jgi:hypothetical protein